MEIDTIDLKEAQKNEFHEKLGFKPQKTIVYNKILPYSSEIAEETVKQLHDIKENLSKAVLLRDIRPSCIHWVSKLSRFIKLYGLCFSKEDHILFVKLAYELVVVEDQEFWVTGKFAQLVNLLLKKRELLSPENLELPWKPLANLYMKLFLSSYKQLGMILLPHNAELLIKSTIRYCRPYFPIEASAEILAECRPKFCPYDLSMYKAVSFLELFLPTMLNQSKAHNGWKLWLNELLSLWSAYHNEPMWGSTMFCLFARLAWQNIGHIEWEEHLPLVFTRVLWQFHLPVSYKKVNMYAKKGLDTWAVSMFIVSNLGGGSKTQALLNQMFKTMESYFHPSNTGYWTRHLSEFQMKLTHYFVQRLHNERHKKESWVTVVPDDKKLTEEDITAFVKCIQPAANLSVFAKTGSYEAGIILNRLALLRPEIAIPPILEQLYSALETMTEPHRLIAALQCIVRVARPLVSGGRRTPTDPPSFPEGPTHVIPLLISSLPGIDPNDINKCMVTFQFIATLVSLIPLTDCSAALEQVDDLTQIEQQVCLQTQEFENFILEFMTRSFALIESSSLENTAGNERENEGMNLEENMIEIGLSSAFKAILSQAHPQLFDVALERLVTFAKGSCMETKVAGKLVATMCRSAAKADSEKTLKALLPSVCRLIITLTEYEEAVEDENLDDKLLFNMLLLSEMMQARSIYVIPYIPKVSEVLHRTLHLKSRKGYKMASSILRHLIWSLDRTLPAESRSFKFSWDTPINEFLPIRHWGEPGDIDNLGIEWVEPGPQQEAAISSLIHEFLIPELEIMKKVTEGGDNSISRDRFHQSLIITQDILAAGGALPMWDEEPMELVEMSVKRNTSVLTLRSHKLEVHLSHPDYPSNVRLAIAETTLKLVRALLLRESDDTKAFNFTIGILFCVCFNVGVRKDEFEGRWKSFERVKQALSDSIVRKKQHIRALLIERSMLQYEQRILEGNSFVCTPTHKKIIHGLLTLSTSQYSEVRKKGQATLGAFFKQFPYSYRLILPNLVEILQKDPNEFHKEIKGALYVIHGCKEKSLIVRRDWDTLGALCPAVVSAQHSEKPSIVKLYDSLLKTFSRYFELFAIQLSVTDSSITAARNLLTSSSPSVENRSVNPSDETKAVARLEERSKVNLNKYNSLVYNLVKLCESGSLHWRRSLICLNMLVLLIRPDVPFPADGVRALLSFSIDDNIILRKVSLLSIPNFLKNQKRTHKKRQIDPLKVEGDHPSSDYNRGGDTRPDNKWLQYNSKSMDLTEEEWDAKVFVHKTWHGWYCWPKELTVYCSPDEQPPVNRDYDQLNSQEKAVYDFFIDSANVEKLISFLSLEESKQFDKFDSRKCNLFKGLFRNFGDTFLDLLEPHLRRLVGDSQESSQRCASEIIAGMMRGTKHWPYKSSQRVLQLTCELLQVVLSKMLNDTLGDWGNCFMHISMDRDPNRMAPLFELFLDDPVREEEGSFLASSRLLLCQLFLEQQEWRISDVYQRLHKSLEPQLSNSYKSIRDRIGVLMYKIFMRDETCHKSTSKTLKMLPCQVEFVERILPHLAVIIQECGSGGQGVPELPHSHHPGAPMENEKLATLLNSTLVAPLSATLQQTLLTGMDDARSERPDPLGRGGSGSIREESMDLAYSGGGVKGVPSLAIPGNGFQPGDSEERKAALRLMNTICRFIICKATYVNTDIPQEIYKFLPHLCQLESIDTDQELRNNCISSLAYLSRVLIVPDTLVPVLVNVQNICLGGWWRARIAALSFLQVVVFNNMFSVLEIDEATKLVKEIVLTSLEDSRPEVRQMAAQVLSGLFHCNLIVPDKKILSNFSEKLNRHKRKRDKETGRLIPLSLESINEKHCGALGLKAFVGAHPYEVTPEMPEVLVTLSEHINDPQPIANDIKMTLSDFRRTHHDNWLDHKTKFTSDQLSILTDVLVSPSYYA